MELLARAFPLLATLAFGVAHGVAWRLGTTSAVWLTFAIVCGALAALAIALLRREEVLGESLTLVPGDITRAIGGAALGIVLLYGVGVAALKLAPARSFEELRALILVATRLTAEWQRALALVTLAACEELVFRGAVSTMLEGRFGSARAPWVASGLYVLATLPSLHPGLIAAAALVGAITALLVGRLRRVTVAIVAHAAFSWLAVWFVLPTLWQRLLTGAP